MRIMWIRGGAALVRAFGALLNHFGRRHVAVEVDFDNNVVGVDMANVT
jgi:hypothetical protein